MSKGLTGIPSLAYLALIAGSNSSANTLVLDEGNIEDDCKIIVSGFYFV